MLMVANIFDSSKFFALLFILANALSSLCISLCGGNITHIIWDKPVYLDPSYLILILSLLVIGVILAASSSWLKNRVSLSRDRYGDDQIIDRIDAPSFRWGRIASYVAIFAAGFIISILVIGPFLFPPFEITDPLNENTVSPVQMVSGHGGIYDTQVQIFVTAPDSRVYPQAESSVDQNGIWNVPGIYFGEAKDTGKEFRVVAGYYDDSGKIHHSREIVVTRS